MGLESDLLTGKFASLPFFEFLSSNRKNSLFADWHASSMRIPLPAAINFMLSLSLSISVLAFSIILALGFGPVFSLSSSSALLCLLLLISLALPALLAARFALSCEWELPFILGEFSICLKMKMPFENALAQLSKSGFASSRVFAEALNSISSGASVQDSLIAASRRVKSRLFERAIGALISEYEEGGSGDSLASLSEDLAGILSSNAKEASGKSSFFGLFYLASAALVPSFFTIALSGSAISGQPPDAFLAWIFFLAIAPSIDIAAMLVIVSFSQHSSPAGNAAFSQDADPAFIGRKNFAMAQGACALLGLAIAASLSFSFEGMAALFLLASVPAAAAGLAAAKSSAAIERMEEELPSAFLSASSSSKSFSIEKALEVMARSSRGLLSQNLDALCRRIRAGESVPSALEVTADSCGSWMLGRALLLLLSCYKTGAKVSVAARHASRHFLAILSLARERRSAFTVQKYTLYFSAIAVPALLGASFAFSLQLAEISSSLPSLLGMGAQGLPQLISSAIPAAQIYLAIFSILTAFFIAFQEGRRGAFLSTACAFAALAQVCFIASFRLCGG